MYRRRVSIKDFYIIKIYKKNPQLAKSLYGKIGTVVSEYCDDLLYWRVKFGDIEINLRYCEMKLIGEDEEVGEL